MTDRATTLSHTVRPPRRGKICAVTVDSTARAYDLTAVDLPQDYKSGSRDDVYLTLQADGGDVFFHFHSEDNAALNDATADAAGAALTQAAAHGAKLPSGCALDVLIDRNIDKYLVLKSASGTPKLRFWPSSQNTAR